MKQIAYLFTLLGSMLLMLVAPVLAHADDVVVGVNLDNSPNRLTPQEQDAIFGAMKDVGVRVIRAGISDDDKGLDFAKRVYAHGSTSLRLESIKV